MKINIKTISEISGFSPTTVSNALNNKKGVNRKTADKILQIAKEYGYVTESKITNIKLVIYKENGSVVSDTPFFSLLIEGIETESRKNGYEVVLFNLDKQSPDYDLRFKELMSDTSSAIILLSTELTEDAAKAFANLTVPLVVLDAWFEQTNFNTVITNNIDSANQAVHYLIEMGHKEIGYLMGKSRIRTFKFRQLGYERAMADSRLNVNVDYFFALTPTMDGAFADMEQFIGLHRKMPTAFFADNDIIALGAMKALQKHGYKIPQDISIIGYDDMPFCQISVPELTTIRVYKKEIGQIAVKRLIEIMNGDNSVKKKISVCNEFVERDSCRRLP